MVEVESFVQKLGTIVGFDVDRVVLDGLGGWVELTVTVWVHAYYYKLVSV